MAKFYSEDPFSHGGGRAGSGTGIVRDRAKRPPAVVVVVVVVQ